MASDTRAVISAVTSSLLTGIVEGDKESKDFTTTFEEDEENKAVLDDR